jgi:hypothetical protein
MSLSRGQASAAACAAVMLVCLEAEDEGAEDEGAEDEDID